MATNAPQCEVGIHLTMRQIESLIKMVQRSNWSIRRVGWLGCWCLFPPLTTSSLLLRACSFDFQCIWLAGCQEKCCRTVSYATSFTFLIHIFFGEEWMRERKRETLEFSIFTKWLTWAIGFNDIEGRLLKMMLKTLFSDLSHVAFPQYNHKLYSREEMMTIIIIRMPWIIQCMWVSFSFSMSVPVNWFAGMWCDS